MVWECSFQNCYEIQYYSLCLQFSGKGVILSILGRRRDLSGPPGGDGGPLSICLQPTDQLCGQVRDLENLHLAGMKPQTRTFGDIEL